MDLYQAVKILHILGAAVLFGTGIGIAFFMYAAHFTQDLRQKYFAARMTVIADFIFTTPAVILQPVTGIWLVLNGGYGAHDLWLSVTYALYVLTGLCWLPVVWIQMQLRGMLKTAVETGTPLPPRYHKLFRIWFALGWPAFIALLVIFGLMVVKPV
ncbi:MAG: DUF2269 domain-containing protein [Bdellovibrionales bacterium]|jgi:uncharacterized membrane protein|nr:DUF2269 domain-containing protein [Bdellovibrionales bacterium]